jgi:hypothetical protein
MVDDLREASKEWKDVPSEEEFRKKAATFVLTRKFAAKGKELGLENTDTHLRKSVSRFRREKLSELYIRRVVVPSIQVTEEDFRKELEGDEPVDIVNLRAFTPQDPSLSGEISREISAGKGFEYLLQKYGSERSRASQGRIGLIKRPNPFIPPEEKDRVYGHGIGRVFGPVELFTGPAFLIIDEKFTAKDVREIARKNVEPVIRERKLSDASDRAILALKKKYPVTAYKQGEKEEVIGGVRMAVAGRIGNTLVTAGEMEPIQGKHVAPGVMDYGRRFEKILRQILFAKAAEDVGLEQDTEFRKGYEWFLDEALASAYKHHVFDQAIPVSEKEMREFYDKNKEMRYFRFKEASYLVLQGVPPEKLEASREKAGNIADAAGLKKIAAELGVKHNLVVRKWLSTIQEPLAGVLAGKKANDIFTLPANDGDSDVYKVIHIQLEERFPSLETVRKDVETHVLNEKKTSHLDSFVKAEWEKIRLDDAIVKQLYREYREAAVKKDVGRPHKGLFPPPNSP